MQRLYCCRCKRQYWGENSYGVVVKDNELESDEAVMESFTLCEACEKEFVDVFMHKSIENPHKIENEEVLLTKAAREDVREFMESCGVDEDMAFFISERIRKGIVHSHGWKPSMLEAMQAASVPEWFIEGCKNILYMSKRNEYRPPYLVDDSIYLKYCPVVKFPRKRETVGIRGVTILSRLEVEKNADLIRNSRPFWVRIDDRLDTRGKCGEIMGPGKDEPVIYHREWGGVYPVLLLDCKTLKPGSSLLFAGEIYTVLREGMAVCKSEYFRVKAPLMTAYSFDETFVKQDLNRWLDWNGHLAEV